MRNNTLKGRIEMSRLLKMIPQGDSEPIFERASAYQDCSYYERFKYKTDAVNFMSAVGCDAEWN